MSSLSFSTTSRRVIFLLGQKTATTVLRGTQSNKLQLLIKSSSSIRSFSKTIPIMSVVAKKFTLAKKLEGLPKTSDFKIVEETLPELQDGEILCKGEWHSVDPYMRAGADGLKPGDMMMGIQVARVVKSRSKEYPEGSQVVGNFGWRDYTIQKVLPADQQNAVTFHAMPEMKGLSDAYALGCLGMPGNTAYHGVTKILKSKPGEKKTLVVSAAAGAVGSLVGQIGKIHGLKVVGYAGTDDKVAWLKKDLGFDEAFNYKKVDLYKSLKESCPEGVDYYFDNVGGEFSYNVTRNMNPLGRIALCGAISVYNAEGGAAATKVPLSYVDLIYKNLTMEGFVVFRWVGPEWFNGISQMRDWIIEGKLKVEQTQVDGFENMPDAFIKLLCGGNTGKIVIKA